MQAFIVRPFGVKEGVDFDKVHNELIHPALKKIGIDGSTTAAIVEQGNIREDMFALLLLADLVIADLSIHNANVFYELGVRHALRDKKTFLIRCSIDEIPFDLKTDRYLSYSASEPAASVEALVNGLRDTMLSDKKDSPVFNMLPKLQAQDTELFLAVPPDFGDEVQVAHHCKDVGKLNLLALEAEGFPWQIPAWRKVGEVLFCLKEFEGSRIIWEKLRSRHPNDREANDRLATIYQRLAETVKVNTEEGVELLAQSDLAIERLLKNYSSIDKNKRAETYSLKGRNAKSRWIQSWKDASETDRRTKALESVYLNDAYESYEKGYYEDLNHFYSGINALGLLSVIIALAEGLPNIWECMFDTQQEAEWKLKEHKELQQKLATVVKVSVEAEKKRLEKEGRSEPWLNITEADLACLTLKRPQRVQLLYQTVIQQANELNFESAKRQLFIYKDLAVFNENVQAALEAFKNVEVLEKNLKPHYLLFTGHMIDKHNRKEPRFPPGKESAAKEAIKSAVEEELKKIEGPIIGIAGGACGGDILFHEVCQDLGVTTDLYLALPREQYLFESVQFAGANWVERFNQLYKNLNKKILSETKELPKWLQKKLNYSIWERNNLWLLYNSLESGGINMTFIALWDKKGGDGAGGTEHMVKEAEKRGAKTVIIDITKI